MTKTENKEKETKADNALCAGVSFTKNKMFAVIDNLPYDEDDSIPARIGLIMLHDVLQEWARNVLHAQKNISLSMVVAEIKEGMQFTAKEQSELIKAKDKNEFNNAIEGKNG